MLPMSGRVHGRANMAQSADFWVARLSLPARTPLRFLPRARRVLNVVGVPER